MSKKILLFFIVLIFISFFNFSKVEASAGGGAIIIDPKYQRDLEIKEINPTSDMVTNGENRSVSLSIKNLSSEIANNFTLTKSSFSDDSNSELFNILSSTCTSSNSKDVIVKVSETEYKLTAVNSNSTISCIFNSNFTTTSLTNKEFENSFYIGHAYDETGKDLNYDPNYTNDTIRVRKFLQKASIDISTNYASNPVNLVKGIKNKVELNISNLTSDSSIFSSAILELNKSVNNSLLVELGNCEAVIPTITTPVYNYPQCYNDQFKLFYNNQIKVTIYVTALESSPTNILISDFLKEINFTDPNSANNPPFNFNVRNFQTGPVELSVSVSDGTDVYIAGQPTTTTIYSPNNQKITILNNSDNDALGVFLTIPKKDGYHLVNLSSNSPNEICSNPIHSSFVPEVDCSLPGDQFRLKFNLEAHKSIDIIAQIFYDYDDIGDIPFTVSLVLPSLLIDTNLANNTATDINKFSSQVAKNITTQIDMSINATTTLNEVKPGDVFENTLTLDNAMPINTNFGLRFTVPEGLEITNITCSNSVDYSMTSTTPKDSYCVIPFRLNGLDIKYPIPSGTIFNGVENYGIQGLWQNSNIKITINYKAKSDFAKDINFSYKVESYSFGGTGYDYNPTNDIVTLNLKTASTCLLKGNSDDYCDFDKDGLRNFEDTDDDNDGIVDATDTAAYDYCLPINTTDACDLDKDGVLNKDDTDKDGDGVIDTDEKVYGDRNGDGVQDYLQGNVETVKNSANPALLTTIQVDSASCPIVQNSIDYSLESTQSKQDVTFDYPTGVLKYALKCSGPVTVNLFFDSSQDLSKLKLRKFGNSTPGDISTKGWYDFPSVISKVTVTGTVLTKISYVLQDGQKGDDTGVDGTIYDPVGLAVPVLSNTGDSFYIPTILGFGLLSLGYLLSRKKYNFISIFSRSES